MIALPLMKNKLSTIVIFSVFVISRSVAFSRAPTVSFSHSRSVPGFVPRAFITYLCSCSSEELDELSELKREIRAVKHCLKGGDSTVSEDILEFIPIYEGGDKAFLRGMLKDLQREKMALIGSKGTLRVE